MTKGASANESDCFSASFWGNSCRGCLESRGLNLHPDTFEMASRIKSLCLKPWRLQSVKWLRSQVVGRKPSMATAATPKFGLRLKKTLLIIVGGETKPKQNKFQHKKKEHCKWLVLIKIMFDTHMKHEAIRSCIRIKPRRKSQDVKKLKSPSYSRRRM